MVDWMVYWVENNWMIYIELDLDCYIFSVVGVVGLLFFDLWSWYDNIQINCIQVIGFGCGLQVVNIFCNYLEDLVRGVDFFFYGWSVENM